MKKLFTTAKLTLLHRAISVCVLLLASMGYGCLVHGDPGPSDKFSRQVESLLQRMTLAEKIGQMTQAELGHLKSFDEVKELALGSVLSGGGSDPKAGNELEAWTAVYDNCQRQALASRLGILILYGVDAVHGHSNVLGAVIFPQNIGLGCTRDAELVQEINRITALEMRATGINWNFAPCVTVPRDIRWGRTFEGFGESPELVSELGTAAIRGLQEHDLSNPVRVLACAKHYLGDGGTKAEVRLANWEGFGDEKRLRLDQGNLQCDEETLRSVHLPPYVAAIEAGVGSIMPSYSSWNGVKCSASKRLLTGILKKELGFEGFVISDYKAIDQISDDYKQAIRISANAGMDMFMVPGKYRKFISLLQELVEEGAVPQARIDDAVGRILRVKAAMGLLDPQRQHLADRNLHDRFGGSDHRTVARAAVRKSIVLLKNNEHLLPLPKTGNRIHVAGRAADDLGIQCGGWTIDWQGAVGEVTSGGTTILDGIREVIGKGSEVRYSADGLGAEQADVAIVVVGELPYAEGKGDSDHLGLSDEDRTTVEKVQSTGVPTVLIVLSGRPIVLGDLSKTTDSIIAAWLPGTEGAGVADVLFGNYPPTGKLSVTWPRSLDQEPTNIGDASYDPEFAFGFGLTYD